MTTSVQDSNIAKKSLRKQMKAKVATISQQNKQLQSKIVTEKVLKSAEYENSKSIALYLHMDDEIQTEDILIQAFKDEKICYIPR
jgi:5-formyltetrahydrofolate cyclo-ligase